MSRPVYVQWPSHNTTAIAALQTLAGAGSLVINGSLAVNGRVAFPSYSRTISLTSVNNLAGVQFTINGLLSGAPVSQTIAGPNNDTVYTAQTFNQVTSISVNGAAAAVSVGTGLTGSTDWLISDTQSTVLGMTVIACTSGTAGTATLSFRYTNADMNANSSTVAARLATYGFLTGIQTPVPSVGGDGVYAPQFDAQVLGIPATAGGTLIAPFLYYSMAVTDSADFAGLVGMSFCRQGLM